MSTIIITTFIITLLIALNALYVAAEFATVSARKTRITQMAAEGQWLAQMLLPRMEDRHALDEYIAACQIGITATSLALGAYSQRTLTAIFVPWLLDWGYLAEAAANSLAAIVVLVFLTILQVVLGELMPKSVAIQYPEKTALLLVLPMIGSVFFMRPLLWFFNGSGNLILHLTGHSLVSEHNIHAHSAKEIEILVTESHEGGLLDDEEQRLLRNAFRLRDLTARQVMVPRTDLVAAPIESTIIELMTLAHKEGFSRIPLYQETFDTIVGFVHTKDLFKGHLQHKTNPKEILREVLYVPETLPAADVWANLNKSGKYLAIVFDEYGGTAGMITFEDLLEEIFGEFQDEFDDELPLVSSDKDGRIYLQGNLLVTDVNEYLNLNLPDEDADTIAGVIFGELGHPPEVGEEVTVGDPPVVIRVEAVEDRRIIEVSLQLTVAITSHIGDWEVAEHE